MRILLVEGDDYAASFFNESGLNPIDVANSIPLGTSEDLAINIPYVSENIEITCHHMEFGPVDPKFIEFIRDRMIDYDYSKSVNFYIVEE